MLQLVAGRKPGICAQMVNPQGHVPQEEVTGQSATDGCRTVWPVTENAGERMRGMR
jgi:hypothetical protein